MLPPPDPKRSRNALILAWLAAHDHPVPNTVRSWAGPRMPVPLASVEKPRLRHELRHPDWYAQPRRRRYS